jgi:nucleotide-binding universal stress UspA family protein
LKKLIPNSAYVWCKREVDVDYGDPATRILRLAEDNRADLIVMGARRGTSWFTHFIKGVAGRVIEQANCPVMTICSD